MIVINLYKVCSCQHTCDSRCANARLGVATIISGFSSNIDL